MYEGPVPEHEGFLDDLRDALAHLDDPPYLEAHRLIGHLPSLACASGLSHGQALRRLLRLAIAALDPGDASSTAALEARSYQVLYQWAICRQGTVAIADMLGISRRQTYRELQRAMVALAQVLSTISSSLETGQPEPGTPWAGQQVRDELDRLARVTDQDVDLALLLNGVVQSARVLAQARGVEIAFNVTAANLHVTANRVMLRQAILNLLSHVVATDEQGEVHLLLDRTGPKARLQIRYRRACDRDDLSSANSPYALAVELFRSLGVTWMKEEGSDGSAKVTILVALAQERTVLIIDDNEGVVALLRRYLRCTSSRVYGAQSAAEALAALDRVRPDVIILDVMMPDRDGWELLQLLRAREAGRRARIVVCSIVNDPQLALALGADAFLPKPVDQASLLHVLGDLPVRP